MPVWFVLICGIVLKRKKLPETGKVARNRKSCPKVSEHLVDGVSLRANYFTKKSRNSYDVIRTVSDNRLIKRMNCNKKRKTAKKKEIQLDNWYVMRKKLQRKKQLDTVKYSFKLLKQRFLC